MKQLKRLAALILLLVQLFMLCGCSLLEEMRESQAFYDSGKILRNGVTYQLLPSSEELCPTVDYTQTVYVTPADVPVLLSVFYANELLMASVDGNFLVSVNDNNIYCCQEMHQQISQRIKDGFTPELVCYSYEVYDEETEEYTEQTYILTDEQTEAIELITSSVEPDVMGEGWWLDYDYSITLEECSGDMLFRRSNLEVAISGSTYYLLLYTDTQTLAFTVPSGCNQLFNALTKAYLDAWEASFASDDDYI